MSKKQKLQFQIGADNRQFAKKMKEVKGLASSAGSSISSTLGVGLGVAGIVTGAKALVDELDNIGKTADRIGVTTDAMQKLKFASDITGNSISTIQTAFKRMSSVVEDAGDGLKSAQLPLEKLGLSFEKLKELQTDKQFELIVEALNNVEHAGQRSALAQDVFGRSGQELLPLIGVYQDLAREAENTGIIISESSIRSAEAFNDAITRMSSRAKAGFVIMGETGVDAAQTLGSAFKDVWEEIAGKSDATKLAESLKKINDEFESRRLKTKGGKEKSKKLEVVDAVDPKIQKQAETYAKKLALMDLEIQKQQLILLGQEKLAKVLQQKFNLEKSLGRKLTDQELIELKEKIALQERLAKKIEEKHKREQALIDEKNKRKKEAEDLAKNESKPGDISGAKKQAEVSDSIRRIGGSIGGTAIVKNPIDMERNKILKTIEKNTANSAGGDFVIS